MKRRRRADPFHGGVPPDLIDALRKAVKALAEADVPFVVVGGLSLAFHFPQYPTDDVDLAVPTERDIPARIEGFKTLSPHVFEERRTGVIVDLVTARRVSVPAALFQHAISTAISHVDDVAGIAIPIATPLAVFAIKLARGRIKDQAHIVWMMRFGFRPREADLVDIGVPAERVQDLYRRLQDELARELKEEEQMGW